MSNNREEKEKYEGDEIFHCLDVYAFMLEHGSGEAGKRGYRVNLMVSVPWGVWMRRR